jgi:cell division protein FtsW
MKRQSRRTLPRRAGERTSPRRGGPRARRAAARARLRRRPDASRTITPGPLDGGIVTATATLAVLGVVMIYSSTAPLAIGRALPPHFLRHLVSLAIALVGIALVLRVPIAGWRRAALPLWAIGTGLMLATTMLGLEVNGARRWLAVPGLPLSFQPAELAKWATLLAVAAVLAGRSERAGSGWRPVPLCTALAAPPVALLLLQPDFGSAAVLIALVGLMLFAAGTPLRRLALPGGVAAAGIAIYIGLRPYALARWRGFLDPWERAHAEGFQLIQSFVAFGRGESFGVGLGDGRQKLFYLPEAHTDFILSVIAEELGLVGVLLVLGAFAALVVAGMRIAGRAHDAFALLTAFGMTTLIAVPAAVNAAVVMGLLPTTGFTLPFLSYGGTSLLTCALAVGILLRIGAYEAPPRPAGGARAAWGHVRR